MKTILKITMLFAFVAFANTLFAAGNLKVNIVPLTSEKAVVSISSLTNSKLKISVEDKMGRVVYYKETIDPNSNYSKVFDFSKLGDGLYNITVVSNDLTTERPFQINGTEIKVGEEKTNIKPFFGYKNSILKCTYLNFQKEKLTLYLYENNHLLYSVKIGCDFNVCKAFNLSKLDKGTYVAILSAGERSYSYSFDMD